jgi:phosphoglycerol transferase MdoB-like AlkP superfamily enzyme
MKLYNYLSKIAILKNYTTKFLFVAFIGIHIPLLGVIAALIYTSGTAIGKVSLFVLILVLTLLATGITLYMLYSLMLPLKKAQQALANYLRDKTVPGLPEGYTDEVGLLMRDINTVANLRNSTEENKMIK